MYLDGWCHDKFVIIFHFMTKLFVGLSLFCTRQWSRALGCTWSIFNLGSKFIFTTSSSSSSSSSAHNGGLVKPNPYLLEVDGKIFRFCFRFRLYFDAKELFVPFNPCESFEIFDPNDSQWLPLDLPPCDPAIANGYLPISSNFEHAVAGSNILRWARECSGVSRMPKSFFLDLHQHDHLSQDKIEYELITTEDALGVKIRLLTTRCLEYDPDKRWEGKIVGKAHWCLCALVLLNNSIKEADSDSYIIYVGRSYVSKVVLHGQQGKLSFR